MQVKADRVWEREGLGDAGLQMQETGICRYLTLPVSSPQVYEVVRPLVSLLDTQRDGLQNYEALLGLTNLSGRSDKLR